MGAMGDSATITIRVAKSVKDRLESLARETKRSKSSLAAEGISTFVDLEPPRWHMDVACI